MDAPKTNGTTCANGEAKPALRDGQFILFDAESDEALLLPREKREKIYTTAQARKIQEREDMLLMLIASRAYPLEEIARRSGVGDHTIRELIARNAIALAADMDRCAGWADGISAAFLALAYEKARSDYDNIPMKDFVAAHSFTGKLALDRRIASAGLKDLSEPLQSLEAEEVNPRRQAFVERLKNLQPQKNAENAKQMEVVV